MSTDIPSAVLQYILKLPGAKYLAQFVASGPDYPLFQWLADGDSTPLKIKQIISSNSDRVYQRLTSKQLNHPFEEEIPQIAQFDVIPVVIEQSNNYDLRSYFAHQILDYIIKHYDVNKLVERCKLIMATFKVIGGYFRDYDFLPWKRDYYLSMFLLRGKYGSFIDDEMKLFLSDFIINDFDTALKSASESIVESIESQNDESILESLATALPEISENKYTQNMIKPMTDDQLFEALGEFIKSEDLQTLYQHFHPAPSAPDAPPINFWSKKAD